MAVVPEPSPAVGARHTEPVFQCPFVAGHPQHQPAHEDDHHDESRYAHYGLARRGRTFARRGVH